MKTPLIPSPRRSQSGVTLVEAAAVVAIASILTGLAVPSFERAIERRHLEGTAAQLETDIHYARSLAVARNAALRISFESGTGGSCYVIHSGAANACTCAADGTAQCTADAVAERSVRFAADGRVGVKSNTRSILFDPFKGTTSPTATVQVVARSGATIRQIVNIMGRVRSCAPAPAPSGTPTC